MPAALVYETAKLSKKPGRKNKGRIFAWMKQRESMTIQLNNRQEEIPGRESMSIQELIEHKNFTFKFLAVRVNGQAVKPADYDSTRIRPGDDVKVLHLISGG